MGLGRCAEDTKRNREAISFIELTSIFVCVFKELVPRLLSAWPTSSGLFPCLVYWVIQGIYQRESMQKTTAESTTNTTRMEHYVLSTGYVDQVQVSCWMPLLTILQVKKATRNCWVNLQALLLPVCIKVFVSELSCFPFNFMSFFIVPTPLISGKRKRKRFLQVGLGRCRRHEE